MAGTTYDEQTRILWFAAADEPTSIAAITVAELADALDITAYVIDANHGPSNDRVDDSDYLTSFNAESMGRYGNQPSLVLRRKLRGAAPGEGEEAYETFERGVTGTLVFFETLDRGADPGAGDAYKAYPDCECGEWQEQNLARNQSVRGQVDFAVGSAPVRGTVVAS